MWLCLDDCIHSSLFMCYSHSNIKTDYWICITAQIPNSGVLPGFLGSISSCWTSRLVSHVTCHLCVALHFVNLFDCSAETHTHSLALSLSHTLTRTNTHFLLHRLLFLLLLLLLSQWTHTHSEHTLTNTLLSCRGSQHNHRWSGSAAAPMNELLLHVS